MDIPYKFKLASRVAALEILPKVEKAMSGNTETKLAEISTLLQTGYVLGFADGQKSLEAGLADEEVKN